MPSRDHNAVELRAVAPLVTLASTPRLVAPVLLVAHGAKTVGITSAELLRPYTDVPLAVVTRLDGATRISVASWALGRYAGLAVVELAEPVPASPDVAPLALAAVRASVEVRGAPASLVAVVERAAGGYARELVDVHVDADDGGGMSDFTRHLASPLAVADAERAVEGAPLFAWYPADPALGRPPETLAVAIAYTHRTTVGRPRDTPVICELAGLDDLGRALINPSAHDARPELAQVAGEIDRPEPAAAAAEPEPAPEPVA